jgi:acyl transferase domain-containing protein
MKVLLHDGYNNFIEIHPIPILKSFINEAISHMGKKATMHHALERGKEETVAFQNLLMLLYLQGFDIQWNKLYPKYLA